MPRVAVDSKHFFTFVAGLITEATGITYPENSMVDGENVDIGVSGICQRRKGVDFEATGIVAPVTISAEDAEFSAISFNRWESVDGVGSINMWVLQVGLTLHFGSLSAASLTDGYGGSLHLVDDLVFIGYNISEPVVVINTGYVYSGDLNLIENPLVLDETLARYTPISMSYGKGRMFCTSKYIEPFYLKLDIDTGILKLFPIVIRERDFEGMKVEFSTSYEPPASVATPDHLYNLKNQGWSATDVASGSSTPHDAIGELDLSTIIDAMGGGASV